MYFFLLSEELAIAKIPVYFTQILKMKYHILLPHFGTLYFSVLSKQQIPRCWILSEVSLKDLNFSSSFFLSYVKHAPESDLLTPNCSKGN